MNGSGIHNTVPGQKMMVFDLYSIWRDVSRQWLSVILIAVSAFVISYVLLMQFSPPEYATTATVVVTNIPDEEGAVTSSGTEVYNTLNYASESAESLTRIMSSSSLQNKVAADTGLRKFYGSASAQTVGDSNLVEITVTTDSPRLSFVEMVSILANYEEFAGDLLGGTELTVLEEPQVAEEPADPYQDLKYALIVALAAFILTAGGIAVRSAMLDTIRSSREVESKLDTSLLATVHHETKHRRSGQKTSILITDPGTSFLYVETMKKLANRIMNEMHDRNEKILLITSAVGNEGKSTVAANAALALSQNGQKVLLADFDFRKPSLYKVLNMQNEQYISLHEAVEDYGMIGNTGLVCKVPGTNLSCVLNNTAAPQTAERRMDWIRRFLEYYSQQYDFIILDSAPMSLVSDTEELVGAADSSVIVVRQHVVEAGEINDTIDALGGQKRMLGCVYNDVREGGLRTAAGGYGYGRRYYGYYGSQEGQIRA